MSEETIKDTVEKATTKITTATLGVSLTPWYKQFWVWICGAAKTLFTLAMPAVKSAVTEFLNNKANQTLAIAAVKAAIDQGLRGDGAWVVARDALETQLKVSAKTVSATLIDTLLQTAYCAVKYSVSGTSESADTTATA